MKYVTTIGYHDGYLEAEIIVFENSKTKSEGEKIGNNLDLSFAYLFNDNLVVGKNNSRFVIEKKDTHLYQFKVCREKRGYLTPEDYENISWDEAVQYLNETIRDFTLPFPLESYYYAVYENEAKFTS